MLIFPCWTLSRASQQLLVFRFHAAVAFCFQGRVIGQLNAPQLLSLLLAQSIVLSSRVVYVASTICYRVQQLYYAGGAHLLHARAW